ncbi:MAG: restriction endonuclease [Pseudomonadota bacterium]
MEDYKFDDLGWYQFERLVQGLLKAELGLNVESWGGRGDWGRDAWSEGQLPGKDRWLLVSKLGQKTTGSTELRTEYERHYYGPVSRQEYQERIDSLDGTFLRRYQASYLHDPEGGLDWVHPSVRDLVIEELGSDLEMQQ